MCAHTHDIDNDTEKKYNLAARVSVTGCWMRRGTDFNISLQNHKQTSTHGIRVVRSQQQQIQLNSKKGSNN